MTGKSLPKAHIFESTNPHHDGKLLIEFQAQTWGEHVVYRNCFWHSEQFLYTTCSHHILQKGELLTKIYLYWSLVPTGGVLTLRQAWYPQKHEMPKKIRPRHILVPLMNKSLVFDFFIFKWEKSLQEEYWSLMDLYFGQSICPQQTDTDCYIT